MLQSDKVKCCRCELDFINELCLEDLQTKEFICQDCYCENFLEGAEEHKAFGKLGILAIKYKGKSWLSGIASTSFTNLLKGQLKARYTK